MQLNIIKEQIACAEYRVDPAAVADAIVRRILLTPSPAVLEASQLDRALRPE